MGDNEFMAINHKKYSPTAIINTPPEQRRHLLARLWLPTVLLLSLAAGGLTGIIAAYELNYSRAANEVAALATYRPSVVTRVYADDGETVIGAGEAYYVGPGHLPYLYAGTEVIEFSPTKELQQTMAVVEKNLLSAGAQAWGRRRRTGRRRQRPSPT